MCIYFWRPYSHRGDYTDCSPVGCDAVYFRIYSYICTRTDPQIFRQPRRHLKTVNTRSITWSRFDTEASQIWGTWVKYESRNVVCARCKGVWISDVQLHAFWTSALDGGEWLVSRSGILYPKEKAPRCPSHTKPDGSQNQSGCSLCRANLLETGFVTKYLKTGL